MDPITEHMTDVAGELAADYDALVTIAGIRQHTGPEASAIGAGLAASAVAMLLAIDAAPTAPASQLRDRAEVMRAAALSLPDTPGRPRLTWGERLRRAFPWAVRSVKGRRPLLCRMCDAVDGFVDLADEAASTSSGDELLTLVQLLTPAVDACVVLSALAEREAALAAEEQQ